ncbi:DUF4190 domain-containing protein [Herbiconiux sp. L3-i23]|uniref:DUF4190 domain-containing protein n=1 Tax=Herbiconiux sp. L3-i23 TaxID=2905871 RepID=UPI002057133A|nr:DUF4190 domain-containing protein [Herbiconiux sp. L3-i23]BDI23829.1 hypothetical protein L3i23_26050 [Herbiconiux sp. L3-i23]
MSDPASPDGAAGQQWPTAPSAFPAPPPDTEDSANADEAPALGAEPPVVDPPAAPPRKPADPVAVLALIAGVLLLSVAALVLGYWANARIRRRDSGGARLARAAVILGWAGLAVSVVFWILYFAVLAPAVTLPG